MISNYTDILPSQKKQSKHKNEPVVIDGIWFQSNKEGNRYRELKEMERVGLISDLRLQPKFEIIPAFEYQGNKEKRETYTADFIYFREGKEIIEDVKGQRLPLYKLKRKIFLFNNRDVNFIET